jgi:hypothetical protein
MVRFVIQSLFLVFYFWSGYSTVQHRTSHIVHQIGDSNIAVGRVVVESDGESRVRYTRFSDAKKIVLECFNGPDSTAKYLPKVSGRQFPSQAISFKSQPGDLKYFSRPPPQASIPTKHNMQA